MRVLAAVLLAMAASHVAADATCAGCSVIVGLVGQIVGTDGVPPTTWPWNQSPDDFCVNITLCDGTCTLWGDQWPVTSPDFPTDGKPIDTAPSAANSSVSLFEEMPLDAAARSEAFGVVMKVRAEAAKAGVAKPHPMLERGIAWLVQNREAVEERGAGVFFGMAGGMARSALAGSLRNGALGNATLPCDDLTNVTCDIHTLFDDHLTLSDGDGDTFAGGDIPLLTTNLRGTSWRGRDCDDTRADVHPGRRAPAAGADASVDHNCNGIAGADPATGVAYEEELCSGPNAPMSVIGVGDSALAHFHIPPQYLNARNFSLDGVLQAASNELDWPQCSWSSGFRQTADCPTSPVEMGSIYQRMVDRNRCNHRGYINSGVNGARVSSAAETLIPNLHVDPRNDNPALVFYALIGNDVCNGHPGLTRMTTPAEFHASVMQSLTEFNRTLPAGSHVAVMGLVQGTILFDTMHDQIHPIGVKYPSVYGALTCNGANPCNGWLTTNATLRALTQQRADNLTAVYDDIIASTKGQWTFDIYRLDIDWKGLFAQYVQKYGNPRGAIEPVDGFHPSQATHQLLADIIWKDLDANRPGWLPPVNPNNAKIEALFGDQGGY